MIQPQNENDDDDFDDDDDNDNDGNVMNEQENKNDELNIFKSWYFKFWKWTMMLINLDMLVFFLA